ncbi:hypothetical protein P8452_35578 [Trifolium repens]|nr:hypothetical protein P8452_35578 [Trifolium repens]
MKITLVSFLLCYYSIYITHASSKCLEDQQSLLLQLKHDFTFLDQKPLYSPIIHEIISRSTKLKMWNKNTTCCNWSGVTCDNEGHVIALDLSGEHILGGFNNSSSLFSLIHLQKLNLDDNYFNSSIPSGFSKLERLTYLNLSMAGFVGQIPAEISQLTRLVTVDLSFISYSTKPQIINLQKLVQNLTKIRKLYLDDISITSQGHEWSNALLPLRDLQELSMYNCDLSGPLDSSLAKLENLSVIILDGNNFSSPVPKTFANFENLTTLSLSDCELIGTFPQKIFQIKTLTILDISFNLNLHGSFPEFPLNGSIHTLSVSFTSFSGEIPRTFEEISLSFNQFSKFDEFINVSSSVLNILDLSNNYLSGPFPTPISQLYSLSIIDLSYNRFNDSLCVDEILELRNLNALDLSHNNISINVNVANHFELPWKSVTGANSTVTLSLLIIRENKPWKMIQIVDIAFNNFNGKLPEKFFTTWEKMMHDEEHVVPRFIHIGNIYYSYQDSVTVSTKGNDGLYGPPLTEKLLDGISQDLHPQPSCGRLVCSNDRNFLSEELGFVFGLGIIIGPIMFWKKWRIRYWKFVDKILCWMFSRMYLEYETNRGQTYTVLRWRYH